MSLTRSFVIYYSFPKTIVDQLVRGRHDVYLGANRVGKIVSEGKGVISKQYQSKHLCMHIHQKQGNRKRSGVIK